MRIQTDFYVKNPIGGVSISHTQFIYLLWRIKPIPSHDIACNRGCYVMSIQNGGRALERWVVLGWFFRFLNVLRFPMIQNVVFSCLCNNFGINTELWFCYWWFSRCFISSFNMWSALFVSKILCVTYMYVYACFYSFLCFCLCYVLTTAKIPHSLMVKCHAIS